MLVKKLLMALARCRTEVTYGHALYCYKHSCCFNQKNIDECDLISQIDYKISEIPKVLNDKNSIWELDHSVLITLRNRLRNLKLKINQLCTQNVYEKIAARELR